MEFNELKDFLDFKVEEYNNPKFIESDPIQLPHRYTLKEDIEITSFLISTIAWGNRKSIIKSGEKLLEIMGESPYDFVRSYNQTNSLKFVHRTFNHVDLDFFFRSLKAIYSQGGLEYSFSQHANIDGALGRIVNFRNSFLNTPHEVRSEKHISNPEKKSAAKRINMFLRWMVRNDQKGVDFGIWDSISPSELYIPLDVHTGNMARKLGLVSRTQNDLTTLKEMMEVLRKMDPKDPVKYDFALFGLGAFEDF